MALKKLDPPRNEVDAKRRSITEKYDASFGEQVDALAAGDIHSAPLGAALQMLERSEDAALVGRALPLLVAREPFVYVRGFRDGLHAYDAEFAARFKLSGLRALPPPVGWPS